MVDMVEILSCIIQELCYLIQPQIHFPVTPGLHRGKLCKFYHFWWGLISGAKLENFLNQSGSKNFPLSRDSWNKADCIIITSNVLQVVPGLIFGTKKSKIWGLIFLTQSDDRTGIIEKLIFWRPYGPTGIVSKSTQIYSRAY